MTSCDSLWINGRFATFSTEVAGDAPYGALEDGALAVRDGKIGWIGPAGELPGVLRERTAEVHDLEGRWVLPGLIDCHTHLVYAGNRAREFELRLSGMSYAEIAAAGGGIRSTVAATRAASEEALYQSALPRIAALLAEGVTTLEVKSGYGLDRETEFAQLRVARRLGEAFPVTLRTTFLGAHVVPPEFEGRAEAYVDAVVALLPELAASGLADAVDAFCETIAFTPEQTARVFDAARRAGLPVKLHADQLSDQGGAALAARFAALSADHLEFASDEGIAAMAAAGSVAVLLPGAYYLLGGGPKPPVEAFRRAGVPLAVATDCNPGSSPVTSLLLMANMACVLFGLTPEEALAGVTARAAAALGLGATQGTLEPGMTADMTLWEIERPVDLVYDIGLHRPSQVIRGGKPRAPLPWA